MTTHAAAPADAARPSRKVAAARTFAVNGRLAEAVLSRRAKGMKPDRIAAAIGKPVEFVVDLIRSRRAAGDSRALTDKQASSAAAAVSAAEKAAKVRGAARDATRAARAAHAAAEEAERLAAEERAAAVLLAAEEAARIAAAAAAVEPEARALKIEFVAPAGILNPAEMGPRSRRIMGRMLRARGDGFGELSRARAHCLHLADLYEECPTFYPSLSVVSDGLTVVRIRPEPTHSACGSAAMQCLTHG